MRRSVDTIDTQRGLLDAIEKLTEVARALPRLDAAFDFERPGYPTSTGGSGVSVNAGCHSDPVLSLAVGLLDGKIDDRAETDSYHLRQRIRDAVRAADEIYRVYARWTPELAHVLRCKNPYGCPDLRPAEVPSRKGLCWPCYSWQRDHDGEHRRNGRHQAA